MDKTAPNRGPDDEGPLPDLISGLMWLATAAAGVGVLVIPATPQPHLGATFAWAVAPDDTADPAELFRLADERLLARKREVKLLARAA